MTAEKQQREVAGRRELSVVDERQLALSLAHTVVSQYTEQQLRVGRELPADSEWDRQLVAALDAAMYGAGELTGLLEQDAVENLDINGCDEVWVTYADNRGKVRWPHPVAPTDDDLIELVQTLASYAGLNARPFTRATPELDLRLPDGSRLSACMSASERPIVSIRRNRFPQMFLPELVTLGTLSGQVAAFLQAAVLARANIMVAGATDAGKTTLLRALINCIPPSERLITVESAFELGLRRELALHPDVVELEMVLPDADGRGGLSIGQLVRRTRRHNPSRVIVGEVMGGEVVEMMSAMSQGNNGSLSTIHARSSADVFQRIATYAAQAENMAFDVSHALIAGSIDFVVYVAKVPGLGNRRCVTEIREVGAFADGRVTSAQIFAPSPVDGTAERADDIPLTGPRHAALARHGYDDTVAGWSTPWDLGGR